MALARTAEQRVVNFNAQALSNTAWAFAAESERDASLFAALARAAKWLMGVFFLFSK